ncbi:hypothetical protein FQR65_LT17752 [Abscondita terminalis]|nr:hypothetical protein FQR65_LT17752 [Abscondita terminalis]
MELLTNWFVSNRFKEQGLPSTKRQGFDDLELEFGGLIILIDSPKAMNGTSPNEEGEVVSYSFANDVVKVDGLAVASRQFNIPKQFKLESATIEFTDWKWLPKRINIEMSWKKPQSYDVDIEAGAYYNGRWGGSKFRVLVLPMTLEMGLRELNGVYNGHLIRDILKRSALEADVDILWIGARSTVNPFTVQEIAQALRGTNKPVLVKNPVNPDLALWIGAMERLLGQDVKNLGVIHRGFSNYQKTKYRNVPNWTIALDFKKQFPNIPMIVDPSHICGNRTGLAAISQEALNCGYEGLMIETHSESG